MLQTSEDLQLKSAYKYISITFVHRSKINNRGDTTITLLGGEREMPKECCYDSVYVAPH